jgi:hypothetical protein
MEHEQHSDRPDGADDDWMLWTRKLGAAIVKVSQGYGKAARKRGCLAAVIGRGQDRW